MTDFFKGKDTSGFLVYLIDDIPTNNTLEEKILSANGFRTRSFSKSKDGMEAVAKEKPDLILLDFMMPDMDGLAFLEKLYSDPANSDIRVIMVSAVNEVSEKMQAKALGAKDYITKPITIEKLLHAVAAQIEAVEK